MGNNPEFEQLKKEINKLKNFNVKESELKKNFDYYKNNLEQFKKINTIIENAKKAQVFKFSPIKAYKIFGGNETELTLPEKWKDLFKMECSESDIDRLFEKSKNQEKTKEKMEKCNTIMEMKNKRFDNWTPYQVFREVYEYGHLGENWEDIYFEPKTFYLDELLVAMEIIDLRNYFNRKFSDGKSLNDWTEKITLNNYEEYKKEKEIYDSNEEKLNQANKIFESIRYKFYYQNEDDVKIITEFANAHLKISSKPETIEYYLKELKKAKKRILRAKKDHEKSEDEEERSNYSKNSYSSSSKSNYSSNNNGNKKVYLKLCQNCKNKCISCGSNTSGSAGASKGFGVHSNCQSSGCFLCGKSNSTVQERGSSYLCKSCYNSHKFDVSKCCDCHKSL